MSEPLLSSLDLFRRTFRIYRGHFKLFLRLSILGPAFAFAVRLLYLGLTFSPARVPSASPIHAIESAIAIATALMLFAGIAISSVATVNPIASILRQEALPLSPCRVFRVRPWRIVRIVLSVFFRAFFSGILFMILGIVALALAAALGYNSRMEAGAIGYACGGISFFAAVLVFIAIYIRYAVAVQACIVEDLPTNSALRRSALFAAPARARIAALYAVFLILCGLLAFVFAAPSLLLHTRPAAFQLSTAIATFLATALAAPVATIGLTLIYFDGRLHDPSSALQADQYSRKFTSMST